MGKSVWGVDQKCGKRLRGEKRKPAKRQIILGDYESTGPNKAASLYILVCTGVGYVLRQTPHPLSHLTFGLFGEDGEGGGGKEAYLQVYCMEFLPLFIRLSSFLPSLSLFKYGLGTIY